ncbi:glycosyltransferase [Limnobacter humi]|uniref:Glycosyltransferase n=1 Tax=Limnobacter humi TaxID=1778671 RepID=A0ABT1WC01_9BURK|nr:glycosyltransferase [Limnobacter humi]MCQ8895036.1 glycosyltransferase [Limnobacter humi]
MPSFLALCAFVLMVFGGYGAVNQPVQEPAWPDVIPGFAFSPYQKDQNPQNNVLPTREDIIRDLARLQGKTRAIRTYTVEGVFGDIPELANTYGINVALGAWIGPDAVSNAREIDRLVSISRSAPHNIVRMLVGNEALLRTDVSVHQLTAYLDTVRALTDIPVSTAEPWHVWLQNPELAAHVDYIAVHLLPFWEGVEMDKAVDYALNTLHQVQARFPDKRVVVSEVGWPSQGRTIQQAVASQANQAIFLRRFIHRAQAEGVVFYVMEAFDQPWKRTIEGAVGAHWGVLDADRNPKFEMRNPIIAVPHWKMLAGVSVGVALLITLFLLTDARALTTAGRSFLMFNAFSASTLVVFILYEFSQQYHTWTSVAVSALMLLGVLGIVVVVLAEAHEWAEALWVAGRQRLLGKPLPRETATASSALPFVSIHVPAYEEPPELLKATLNALARLDYPQFEVLVIDNNTRNEATWKPVQAHCMSLDSSDHRFRFFHVNPLAGYKAGALNLALDHTDARAEVVAVIDADYQVASNWLRDLMPAFSNPSIAIVQAPQDYRDASDSAFKALCYAEYKGFFHVGMVTRNERNAIIQHGTMTLVRRSVLDDVGGWGTHTVTEDAELGLRIFEAGHEATYIDHSYGQGLMPDTFLDYKKQRHRWAYGAMQIVRAHAAALLGFQKTGLTAGQRYHFLAGWLPWMADGLNLLFTGLAVIWSVLMLINPLAFNAPPLLISVVPFLFFVFKLVKLLTLYTTRVGTTLGQALAATLAGLSLSYTIGHATLSGLLLGRAIAFARTPKTGQRARWRQALAAARGESICALALLSLQVLLLARLGLQAQENLAWCGVLLLQSVPCVAAVVVSLLSARAEGLVDEKAESLV